MKIVYVELSSGDGGWDYHGERFRYERSNGKLEIKNGNGGISSVKLSVYGGRSRTFTKAVKQTEDKILDDAFMKCANHEVCFVLHDGFVLFTDVEDNTCVLMDCSLMGHS